MRSALVSVLIGGLVMVSGQAFGLSTLGYDIPKDEKVIFGIGKATQTALPRKFKMFDWNIEKAKQTNAWAADFTAFSQLHDLVIVQEASSDDFFLNTLKSQKSVLWNYFVAWLRDKDQSFSGLVMGSQVAPTSVTFRRTEDVEPFIKTPKLSGYQTYKVTGLPKNQQLLVVNIHAINFVSTDKFVRQITQVMTVISQHVGPVIFVGDMNTWNKSRLTALLDMTAKGGLTHVDFARPDVKGMHSDLDQLFVRGLKVKSAGFLQHVTTSDHFPISAEFELL